MKRNIFFADEYSSENRLIIMPIHATNDHIISGQHLIVFLLQEKNTFVDLDTLERT